MTWLPRGRLGVGSVFDVYVMNADGSGKKRVTHGELPVWSPSGRKVVVGRYYQAHDTTKLFIVDVRTGAERVIRQPRCRCAVTDDSPLWSPDGRRLVFTRFVDAVPSQTSELDVINANATHLRRVVAHEIEGAAWAPKGDRVAGFDWDGSGPVVKVIAIAGGKAVRIGRGSSPNWSPDGHLLAFRGRNGAYVARPDGAAARRLVGPTGSTCPPTCLYFRDDRCGRGRLISAA